jgi:hypothetical protein
MLRVVHTSLLLLLAGTLAGCASAPPRDAENLCAIFDEKRDWYRDAKAASERWGAPLQVPMAIMFQESSFRADARPPMRYLFGFIPIGRASSAFGYSQAKTASWNDYKRETGQRWASRDDFGDAMDFVQWYIDKSRRINGVSKWDAYALYLNYHEGWGGYRRGTWRDKAWLIETARRVDARASRYGAQYRACREDLERRGLWRWLFG